MDTETFLVTRDRLVLRLSARRKEALEALEDRSPQNGHTLGISLPFWLRMVLTTFLPKRLQGFWPRTLIAAAPVVFGLVKNVASIGKSSSGVGGLLSFLPIVKSLIKRYN